MEGEKRRVLDPTGKRHRRKCSGVVVIPSDRNSLTTWRLARIAPKPDEILSRLGWHPLKKDESQHQQPAGPDGRAA